jgi:hypothetical protein
MEENNTMPQPYPLDVAMNESTDLKNAELSAEESTSNTEKVITKAKMTEKEVEEFVKSKGYVKASKLESKSSIMWKSALLGLLTVLFGFWAKFLLQCFDPSVNLMYWNTGAFVDACYNTIISISGIGFFGKMKKYYDIQLEG